MTLLAACKKDSVENEIPNTPGTATLRIHADGNIDHAGSQPASRAAYSDGLGLRWQTADAEKMAVCCLSGGQWSTVATRSIAIGEDLKATFEADVPDNASQAWFYYPYSADNNGTKHKFNFAAAVTQAEAGSTEHLALAAQAAADLTGGSWTATPKFKLVGAVVRFIVYSGTATTERVTGVQLRANAELSSTEYEYDLAAGSAEALGIRTKEVTVSLTEPSPLDGVTSAEQALGIYVPIRPATTTGYTYVVTTDKGTYEFQSDKARTWEEGRVYDVKLNLDKGRHALQYVFDNVSASVLATTEPADAGYYLAYLDGAAYPDFVPETSPLYRMLRFDCGGADWLKAEIGSNNHIFVSCTSEATEKRSGTIDVWFDGSTDIYTLENPGRPLFSIAVTQIPADHAASLHYTWNDVKTALTLTSTARTQLGWYFAYLDGSETRVPDSHEVIGMLRFDYADPADAEWLTSEFAGNNIFVTCTSAAAQKRTATVHVLFDPAAPNAGKYTLSDSEPLFTFTITQLPENYRYLSFHFGFDGASNRLDLAADAGKADRELAWASIYAVDGSVKTRFDDNSGIYSTDYIEFYSDVAWLGGAAPNVNKLHCTVAANETYQERVGHLYGRMKQPFPRYEEYDSDDPLFTVTVTQAPKTHLLQARFYIWNEWGGSETQVAAREVAAAGVTDARSDSAQFRIDGGEVLPADAAEYAWVRVETTADWLTGRADANQYLYSCTPNQTGAERTAELRVYLEVPANVTQKYAIGNWWGADWQGTDPTRLFTINVTQKAQ